jgi:hypothetical protein
VVAQAKGYVWTRRQWLGAARGGGGGRAVAAVGGGRIMVCDYCGVRYVMWAHENEWILEDVSCESEKNETMCFLCTPDQHAQETISNFKYKLLKHMNET